MAAMVEEVTQGIGHLTALDVTARFDPLSELQKYKSDIMSLLALISGNNDDVRVSRIPIYTSGMSSMRRCGSFVICDTDDYRRG